MSDKFVVCHECKTVLLFPKYYGVTVLVKEMVMKDSVLAQVCDYRMYCLDCYEVQREENSVDELTIDLEDEDDFDY